MIGVFTKYVSIKPFKDKKKAKKFLYDFVETFLYGLVEIVNES